MHSAHRAARRHLELVQPALAPSQQTESAVPRMEKHASALHLELAAQLRVSAETLLQATVV